MKPAVFDVLSEYVAASSSEGDDEVAVTAAIAFCENFYAQFFPNVSGVEIQTLSLRTKFLAVQVRRKLKTANEAKETIQLITWFEKLCDIYPDVVSMGRRQLLRGHGTVPKVHGYVASADRGLGDCERA